MFIVGFVCALAIGSLLGLLGGGGSILAVPVFAYVLELDPKLAIAASFGVVGLTSLVGAWPQYRRGNVDLRAALLFAAGSAVVAFGAGAYLSRLLSGAVQMVVFAIVMLTAAVFMMRGRGAEPVADPSEVPVDARESQGPEPRDSTTPGSSPWLVVLIGALVGALTGIAGVGGGFMIVPALVLLGGIGMKRAVGTSLVVIAINSAAALVGYLLQPAIRSGMTGAHVGAMSLLPYLAIFTLITIGGTFVGAWLGRRIAAATLRVWFAVFLVVMAVYLIARNIG